METPFLQEVHGNQLLGVVRHICICPQRQRSNLLPSVVQVEAKANFFKAGVIRAQVDHSDG